MLFVTTNQNPTSIYLKILNCPLDINVNASKQNICLKSTYSSLDEKKKNQETESYS